MYNITCMQICNHVYYLFPLCLFLPAAASELVHSFTALTERGGKMSSSKLIRSPSPTGLLCKVHAERLVGANDSPRDLKAVASAATESLGAAATGFSKAE